MLNKTPMVDCLTGGEPYQKTEVTSSIYDGKIVVEFNAINVCPRSKHDSYNAPLYDGDIVEILLTLGDRNRYLEVEVNQNGALYVAIVNNRDGVGDIEVTLLDEHKITYNSTTTHDFWHVDVILPIEWLESLGYQDDAYCNLLRQDVDAEGNMHLSCVSPTKKASFHQTAAFFRLNKGDIK